MLEHALINRDKMEIQIMRAKQIVEDTIKEYLS
jgi:hypothetical protein